jgi:hypothetical protein
MRAVRNILKATYTTTGLPVSDGGSLEQQSRLLLESQSRFQSELSATAKCIFNVIQSSVNFEVLK